MSLCAKWSEHVVMYTVSSEPSYPQTRARVENFCFTPHFCLSSLFFWFLNCVIVISDSDQCRAILQICRKPYQRHVDEFICTCYTLFFFCKLTTCIIMPMWHGLGYPPTSCTECAEHGVCVLLWENVFMFQKSLFSLGLCCGQNKGFYFTRAVIFI